MSLATYAHFQAAAQDRQAAEPFRRIAWPDRVPMWNADALPGWEHERAATLLADTHPLAPRPRGRPAGPADQAGGQ
jgi:hypothetical protein